MIWFCIDSFLLMLLCFAVGSLIAWLIAVAAYPRIDEAFTDLEVEEGP